MAIGQLAVTRQQSKAQRTTVQQLEATVQSDQLPLTTASAPSINSSLIESRS